jgi:hypothetical protein
MRTRLALLPGDHGARRLYEQYGEQLVCVRYRYDEQLQKRFKTVELIIKEYDWKPQEKIQPTDAVVQIRATPSELKIRRQVKQVGGVLKPQLRVWEFRLLILILIRVQED